MELIYKSEVSNEESLLKSKKRVVPQAEGSSERSVPLEKLCFSSPFYRLKSFA
jgi:hypothetical protein